MLRAFLFFCVLAAILALAASASVVEEEVVEEEEELTTMTQPPATLPTTIIRRPTIAPMTLAPQECYANICAMYSGDPHLMRFRVDCKGKVENFPTQHCAKALTLQYAKSIYWNVTVKQSLLNMGNKTASAISSVIFTGVSGKKLNLVLDKSNKWPKSNAEFTVEILSKKMVKNKWYDTAAVVTGRDMSARIQRTLWVANNGAIRQIMSINICSPRISSGVALNGCPAHSIVSTTPVSETSMELDENSACALLPDPFRGNCNMDAKLTSNNRVVQAMIEQSTMDAQSQALLQNTPGFHCQWSYSGC